MVGSFDCPTVVAGDFNLRPQDLDIWNSFCSLGYSEAFEQFQHQFGEALPPTFNSSTRNDTMVYSHHLASLFLHASVHHDAGFAQHSPLTVEFSLSPCKYVYRHLTMPDPLDNDVLHSKFFENAQQQQVSVAKGVIDALFSSPPTECNVDRSLQLVGKAFDEAYCNALQMYNTFVPPEMAAQRVRKSRMQRLQPREVKSRHPQTTVRRARHGAYEPHYEVFKVRNFHLIKQLRRVQAYLHRAKKYGDSPLPANIAQQSHREWTKILYAPGFQPTFAKWVLETS